ncbi:MAG: AAA family ATPase, partial [Pseudomonadales bacterium]
MFTSEAQFVIDRGKDVAVSRDEGELTLTAVATSVAMNTRGATLLASCLSVDPAALSANFPAPDPLRRCSGKLPLAQDVRDMLGRAKDLVKKVPASSHQSLIALPHLVCTLAQSLPEDAGPDFERPSQNSVMELLTEWIEEEARPPSLGELTRRVRALREELLRQIYGQDQAMHQFVEGLFNVEVVREADTARRKPAGLFVFAGPPGVGKTFLAELASSYLDRPFKRFDMSGFAHGHEINGLIGSPPVYKGAQPGALTQFVNKNPNAVLLFDEIEKAHRSIINLFLQLLDAGRLQDKYTEEDIAFRDTIVIFTTNVGQTLYDNENNAGVHQANAAFHRNTILDALRSERDPRTGEPHFPTAICSRMATGYPILFNHLQVPELARVAESELQRVGSLLERQHGQRYSFAEEIPLAIVMREGARTDARTVKAQVEAFVKGEVFKACGLFAEDRIDGALAQIEQIDVEIDGQHAGDVADRIFSNSQRSVVLFTGDGLVGRFLEEVVPDVEWCVATGADQALDVLT